MSDHQDLREEVEREVAEAIADGADWAFVRFSLGQVKALLDDYDAKCAEVDALKVRLADIHSRVSAVPPNEHDWSRIVELSRPEASNRLRDVATRKDASSEVMEPPVAKHPSTRSDAKKEKS